MNERIKKELSKMSDIDIIAEMDYYLGIEEDIMVNWIKEELKRREVEEVKK